MLYTLYKIYINYKVFKAKIFYNNLKENKDIMIIKENLNFLLILKGNTFYYVNLEYLISLKRIFTANRNNDKKEILDIIFELSPDCIKLKLYSNIEALGIDNKIEEKWFIYNVELIRWWQMQKHMNICYLVYIKKHEKG